jgi:hypothetical protein
MARNARMAAENRRKGRENGPDASIFSSLGTVRRTALRKISSLASKRENFSFQNPSKRTQNPSEGKEKGNKRKEKGRKGK